MQQKIRKPTNSKPANKPSHADDDIDPRILKTRRIVLASTAELLAELGFRGITVEHISEHSGVARSTIYRHWPNTKDLLVETFEQIYVPTTSVDHGNLREDLIEHCNGLAHVLNSNKTGRIIGSLISSSLHDEELSTIHARYTRNRRRRAQKIIQRAIDRGELKKSVDREHMLTSLVAPIFYQRFIAEKNVTFTFVERVVEGVLLQYSESIKHKPARQ